MKTNWRVMAKSARLFTVLTVLAAFQVVVSARSTALSFSYKEHQALFQDPGVALITPQIEPRQTGQMLQDELPSAARSIAAPLATQASTGDWHTECVECPKRFGPVSERSLRLDNAGHPHVVYGGDHLYYAWHDGTRWQYQTVDGAPGVGSLASLALDGSGYPHISYYDSTHSNVKYTWYDGASWRIETVAGRADYAADYEISLALDSLGRPHLSYVSYGLQHAWRDETGWHSEIVTSDTVGGDNSLALDGADRPHISYVGGSYGQLCYAWYDGTGWQTVRVDSAGRMGTGFDNSLALDGAGRPHIGYRVERSGPGMAQHAWYDGADWQVETVGDGGRNTSLALDALGRPHMSSFYGEIGGDFKYAWHDGTSWHIETIAPNDVPSTGSTSLALEVNTGQPHVVYYGNNSSNLVHAWQDGTGWRSETVERQEWAHTRAPLVLDKLGQAHVCYSAGGLLDYNVKYATYDGAGWHSEVVPTGEGDCFSLALDGAGYPHMGTYDGRGQVLQHIWQDGSGWHAETVDNVASLRSASFALDGLGRPHISYYNDVTGLLKYAWHDGAAWHIDVVDTEGGYNSLALDKLGRPHISYYDEEHYSLKYAWYDGTSWQTSWVDTSGYAGLYSSLVLDEASRPHISYVDWRVYSLKYAWHDGTSWHIETVDQMGTFGYNTSLALDEAGQPHIAYGEESGLLKYAERDRTGWRTEWVTGSASPYGGASLALDGASRAHILYHDAVDYDLKYARWVGALFLDQQVTPVDSVRHDGTLTYTLVLSGAGLNAHLWDPLPDGLHYVTGSLTTTLDSPAVYDPAARAVSWQGQLVSGTLGTIRFQAALSVTGARGVTGLIANTAWLSDTYGRVLSSTVTTQFNFPSIFLSKAAAPLEGLTNRDMVTYTLTVSGAGQNATLWDPLPAGIHYVSGSLTSTLATPAIYSPTARAITWQGVLPTDTLGLVRFQVTRGITGPGSLDLSLPIVNTAWLTDTDNSTHVEATVIVNGYRLYLPLLMRNM